LNLEPEENGRLRVRNIIQKYENAYQMQNIAQSFQGKKYVTFTEYYNVMVEVTLKRKANFGG